MQFFQRQQLRFSDYCRILGKLGQAINSRSRIRLDLNEFETPYEDLIYYLVKHRITGIFDFEGSVSNMKDYLIQKTLTGIQRQNLLSVLVKNSIQYFELKGAVLEEMLYSGTEQIRLWGDTDIYIKRSELKRALNAFFEEGFQYDDFFMPIQSRIRSFGSLNIKGQFSKCDLHYDLGKAGKYRIVNFPEKEIFTTTRSYRDTVIPEKTWFLRLLLFHFYAKHNMFTLSLLFELILILNEYIDFSYLSVVERLVVREIKHCERILLGGASPGDVIQSPVLLSNKRFEITYFEKRLMQLGLFALPSGWKRKRGP